ncbi:hypothetical protein L7F22_026893 [Adiantum nelumboides]|nr:hypothetical protein [Adiantum nelumboides]
MQGSSSQDSYAHNSWFQNYNFHSVGKPRLGDAIQHLLASAFSSRPASPAAAPRAIAIADLGCSYGRNTLDCAEFVLRSLRDSCSSLQDVDKMEIQYFFSDLPSNDFNALFQSLQPYLHQSDQSPSEAEHHHHHHHPLPKIFAAGAPGSFYGRLFPTASLDLVICSYSLHWLSQVPPQLLDRSSPAWNGDHTWTHRASKHAQDAFAVQSQADVKNFLKCRAHEISKGGMLFLYLLASTPDLGDVSACGGQHENDNFQCSSTVDIFDLAWKELVDEVKQDLLVNECILL